MDRKEVYQKYNGHCAYCGTEIDFKAMEVDHLFPKSRVKYELRDEQPNVEIPENYMPSCRKCNRHKGSFKIEEWRKELSLQVSRLRKSAQFDRARRFRQIQITESPIMFYYEQIETIPED